MRTNIKQCSSNQRVKKIQQIVLHLLLSSLKVFSTLDGIAFMQLKEHDSLQKWHQQANLSGRNGPMIIRRGQHKRLMRELARLMLIVKMVFQRKGCQNFLRAIDVYATCQCVVKVYFNNSAIHRCFGSPLKNSRIHTNAAGFYLGAKKDCISQYTQKEVLQFLKDFWALKKFDQDSLVPSLQSYP